MWLGKRTRSEGKVLTLRKSAQAVPLYLYLVGPRRLAFSVGCANGHCVQSCGLALGQRRTCTRWKTSAERNFCVQPSNQHLAFNAAE